MNRPPPPPPSSVYYGGGGNGGGPPPQSQPPPPPPPPPASSQPPPPPLPPPSSSSSSSSMAYHHHQHQHHHHHPPPPPPLPSQPPPPLPSSAPPPPLPPNYHHPPPPPPLTTTTTTTTTSTTTGRTAPPGVAGSAGAVASAAATTTTYPAHLPPTYSSSKAAGAGPPLPRGPPLPSTTGPQPSVALSAAGGPPTAPLTSSGGASPAGGRHLTGREVEWGSRSVEMFLRIEKVGEGTYGEVFSAKNKITNDLVALKRVRMDNEKEGFPITAIREIKILKQLRHKNIVHLEEIVTSESTRDPNSKGSIYMVFEYMDHDLHGLMDTPEVGDFSEAQIKCYMKQLLEGLHFCHNNSVLHRDIKGSNLLINNKGELKLADFGLARPYNKDAGNYTNRVITLWYRPPELLLGATQYGPAIDLWSVGCILAELVTRKPLFPGQTDAQQLEYIIRLCGKPTEANWPGVSELKNYEKIKGFKEYKNVLRAHFSGHSASAVDLIDKLLQLDPRNRLSAHEALDHDYFWTDPLPCPPSSLPNYPSSHELQAKRRRQEFKEQNEAKRMKGPDGAPIPVHQHVYGGPTASGGGGLAQGAGGGGSSVPRGGGGHASGSGGGRAPVQGGGPSVQAGGARGQMSGNAQGGRGRGLPSTTTVGGGGSGPAPPANSGMPPHAHTGRGPPPSSSQQQQQQQQQVRYGSSTATVPPYSSSSTTTTTMSSVGGGGGGALPPSQGGGAAGAGYRSGPPPSSSSTTTALGLGVTGTGAAQPPPSYSSSAGVPPRRPYGS